MTITEYAVIGFLLLQVLVARLALAASRASADSYKQLYQRAEKHVDELLNILRSKQSAEFDPWPVQWQERDEEKN